MQHHPNFSSQDMLEVVDLECKRGPNDPNRPLDLRTGGFDLIWDGGPVMRFDKPTSLPTLLGLYSCSRAAGLVHLENKIGVPLSFCRPCHTQAHSTLATGTRHAPTRAVFNQRTSRRHGVHTQWPLHKSRSLSDASNKEL
jgi:hypothetical protein